MEVRNLEDIPLTHGSHVAGHGIKNEQIYSEMKKKCKDMELYVLHDVIISDGEEDEQCVDDVEEEEMNKFNALNGTPNTSDRRRELRRKVNLIDVGVNFVLSYCGRCPSAKSSIGENIAAHPHYLRASYCIASVLKAIVTRYIVDSHAITVYPSISVKEWDKRLSDEFITLEDLKSTPCNQMRCFSKMVTSMSNEYFKKTNVVVDEESGAARIMGSRGASSFGTYSSDGSREGDYELV